MAIELEESNRSVVSRHGIVVLAPGVDRRAWLTDQEAGGAELGVRAPHSSWSGLLSKSFRSELVVGDRRGGLMSAGATAAAWLGDKPYRGAVWASLSGAYLMHSPGDVSHLRLLMGTENPTVIVWDSAKTGSAWSFGDPWKGPSARAFLSLDGLAGLELVGQGEKPDWKALLDRKRK